MAAATFLLPRCIRRAFREDVQALYPGALQKE